MEVHGAPAALAFLLDSTLGGIGAEVLGNDGAGSLHVEEIGGQGALRRVGIMSSLLALLLLLNGRQDQCTCWWEEDQRIFKLTQLGADLEANGTLAQKQVGLAEIVDGKALDEILNGREPGINLPDVNTTQLRSQSRDSARRSELLPTRGRVRSKVNIASG